jgi:hypothetical protein
MYPDRRESADGHELAFAVNHLAPFLLTNLLLDMLECRVTEVQHHVLPAPLVIRDSCGALTAERSANRHESHQSV